MCFSQDWDDAGGVEVATRVCSRPSSGAIPPIAPHNHTHTYLHAHPEPAANTAAWVQGNTCLCVRFIQLPPFLHLSVYLVCLCVGAIPSSATNSAAVEWDGSAGSQGLGRRSKHPASCTADAQEATWPVTTCHQPCECVCVFVTTYTAQNLNPSRIYVFISKSNVVF